ncbi:hypothetical protein [Umezawaea sp. NPDC059074]|uniref:hypothetical protein n=1 Tax=Umezawaea sp. NPDC059074 TaxID=3346716 RepID=UPI003699361D
MSQADFRRSLLVSCDLRKYGAADDQLQRILQELLVQSLDRAGAAAGLDRSSWHRQPLGDEEFAVLPPDSPESTVVDTYVRALAAELHSLNRYRVPEARVRMRMAIHHGVVVNGANGFPGRDTVLLNRLLSSHPAHQALDDFPNADLVLILSEHLYDTLVAAGHTTFEPTDFRKVDVTVKTFSGHGWMWVAGADVHAVNLTGATPVAAEPVAEAEPPGRPGTINQHAVATHGSTVYQAGRDLTVRERGRK